MLQTRRVIRGLARRARRPFERRPPADQAPTYIGRHASELLDMGRHSYGHPKVIAYGNPARETRRRFSDEECEQLLNLAWWDWPDERIREAVPLLRAGDVAALARFAAGTASP